MLFSLICLAGFMSVVCAPGLIAQSLSERRARADMGEAA